MRHGCSSDTRADLSLRALYVYLTSFVTRLLVRVFTVQYNDLFSHTTKTVTSWVDAQTAQIVSFEILVLLMALQHEYIMPKSPINKA